METLGTVSKSIHFLMCGAAEKPIWFIIDSRSKSYIDDSFTDIDNLLKIFEQQFGKQLKYRTIILGTEKTREKFNGMKKIVIFYEDEWSILNTDELLNLSLNNFIYLMVSVDL